MTIEGIDVSEWQTTTPSLVGLDFVIVKASEGTRPDPMYAHHVANVKAAGLVTGAYHFNRADVNIANQVDAFIKVAGDVDLYALDVEEESPAGVQRFSLAQAQTFISRFRSITGKKIGLYASESGYIEAGQDFDWVAHYGVAVPTRHWDFHQYTSTPIDKNRFNGDKAALLALAGGDAVKAITSTVPATIDWADGTPYFALDGTTRIGLANADTARYSPFACGGQRAFYTGAAGLALITPTGTPHPIVAPVTDCAPAVKAATDPLKADLATLNTAVVAFKADLAAAEAATAAAARTERERIAGLEAARIRSI